MDDEAGALEHAQVFAHCRPTDRQCLGNRADRKRPAADAFDDAASHRIAERIEHGVRDCLVPHG
jgi:hypothetical protein